MKNLLIPRPLIKRSILQDIEASLERPEITMLIGPRQAGKTTIMKLLIHKLTTQKKRTLYLNLDLEEDRAKLESQLKLISYLKLTLGQDGYVFIDEIQRKENAGLFLKGLYDRELPYKFVVSGSGSVELKEKISESLAGRKLVFEIFPITFYEFVDWKLEYKYSNNLVSYLELLSPQELEAFLEEYMWFGGYPKVLLSNTLAEKRVVLEGIMSSFIDKDIRSLLNVNNPEELQHLLSLLAIKVGKLTPTTRLSNETGLSVRRIKQYIYYLEKTFIIKRTLPFFTNPENELRKTPIYYFNDLGMRNLLANNLTGLNIQEDGSMLFQNLVYLTLLTHPLIKEHNIKFWRTKNKAEVDLVVRLGTTITPVEVKFKDLTRPVAGHSAMSFIKKYSPKTFIVINKTYEATRQAGKTTIKFVPFYRLIDPNFIEREILQVNL